MKSETIIKKIINQIDANAEIMKGLLEELDDSLNKENIKLKEDIAKKISLSFNLDLNQVLKKIIKKKKNNNDTELTEQLANLEQIENLEETKDFIPIYKKILYNDKEYFYDDKPDGVVLEITENNITKIVGYIDDIGTKNIKFM
jgi:hypothetical protein